MHQVVTLLWREYEGKLCWVDEKTGQPARYQPKPPKPRPTEEELEVKWKSRAQASEQLNCDWCGVLIGWVDACDLEGSYFFCGNCKQRGE